MSSHVATVEAPPLEGLGAPCDVASLPEESRRQLLGTVMESSTLLVCIFSLPSLRLIYVNKAGGERLNPGSRGDVHNLSLSDFIGLSLLKRLQAEILPQAQVLGRWTGECELRDVWGSEFMVSAALTTHRHRRPDGGRAEFLCLHAQSGTPAPAGHETHFNDRELLHALLEHAPDSVYFKDEASRFVRVSRAKAEKHGFGDARNIIGKTDFDLFAAEHAGRAYADEQRIFQSGEAIVDQEEKLTWADGRVTWASSTKLPLHDPAGQRIGTFGISRDITARKLAEAQHREMEIQLQLAQKLESIGRLAAGVAHEINTPTQFITDNSRFLTEAFQKLGAVLASHRALQAAAGAHADCAAALQAVRAAETEAELDYLTGEIPRCLQQSLDGLARVARIVRSLKEFAHPSSPDLTPADLNHVIETAVAVSRHEWKYVAEVVTEFDPELPLVPCVVDEFNQVILNLVINAAHAIGDALKLRGEAQGKITVRTRCEGPWAIVDVEDTGTGMTPEVRQRIFEPFFTTKAAGKGTGQGLAIVQAIIVKSHHGTIDVRTEPGRGTTFVLRLPLTAPASPPTGAPPPLTLMKTSKILFVDDDENLLAAIQRTFRKQFSFDTALGGLPALELLRTQGPYALIVSDMSMPGMNGVEFLEQARQVAPEAVRIMLTGNADQQTAAEAVNRGHVFRFLSKPCPPETLVPAIEHGLKQYELLQTERELLEGTLMGSVKMMSEVLGMVAPDALGRGQRLRDSMREFAKFIGAESVWELEIAALLSSIGFASMPASIGQRIASGFEPTKTERAILEQMPQVSHDLLAVIPRLEGVARIVLFQNKAFDGCGFPQAECAGEELPLGARMLKILSDRLTLESEGIVKQRAFELMRARPGAYDPRLLERCFACFQTFLANAVSAERPVLTLRISQLSPGQVVVSDITTPDGLVLVGAGNRLTPMILARLHNYDGLGEVKQPVLMQDAAPQAVQAAA